MFRILQGMFGAALVPLSQSVMLEIYPPEQRGWAMSLWGMGVMIGPIMGPILGGLLTEYYTWRWIFFINLPVGIATVLGLLTFMDETEATATLVVRLVRLCRAQHRHRRAAADARPRRAAGLVRFQRDRADGHRLGRRLLFLHRALADDRAAVHLHRDLPRPQLRHRPDLHVRVRRAAGRVDGADGADACRTSWATPSSTPGCCSARAASAWRSPCWWPAG